MKKFEKPAMEKVEFESNDVITTSGCISDLCFNDERCPADCRMVCSGNSCSSQCSQVYCINDNN